MARRSPPSGQVGVMLSFVLLALGVAELTETVNILPVSAYVLVLWVIAILLWLIGTHPGPTDELSEASVPILVVR